jgi:hypothetical protein
VGDVLNPLLPRVTYNPGPMRFPESSDCAPVGLPPIPKCPKSRVIGNFPHARCIADSSASLDYAIGARYHLSRRQDYSPLIIIRQQAHPAQEEVQYEAEVSDHAHRPLVAFLDYKLTTPGHTLGTLGLLFQVKDHGKQLNVVYSGGTAFNNQFDAERFRMYIASQRKLAQLAADSGATVLLSNHSEFDDAYTKGRLLASRGPGDPNPFEVGRESVARYFKTSDECAQAARLEYK